MTYVVPVASDQIPLVIYNRTFVQSRKDPFGQIEYAFVELRGKILSLGLLNLLLDQLGALSCKTTDPNWFQLDRVLPVETFVYLLPIFHCSQGNYCLLLELAGQSDGLPAYKRVGFARADYKGCLAKTNWRIPGWTHTQPWPIDELQAFQLV